jgi:hypothetical protein
MCVLLNMAYCRVQNATEKAKIERKTEQEPLTQTTGGKRRYHYYICAPDTLKIVILYYLFSFELCHA